MSSSEQPDQPEQVRLRPIRVVLRYQPVRQIRTQVLTETPRPRCHRHPAGTVSRDGCWSRWATRSLWKWQTGSTQGPWRNPAWTMHPHTGHGKSMKGVSNSEDGSYGQHLRGATASLSGRWCASGRGMLRSGGLAPTFRLIVPTCKQAIPTASSIYHYFCGYASGPA